MKNKKAASKKNGISLSTIIAVAILLVGLSVLLYPTVSNYWNSFHESRAVANYDETIANMEEEDYDALFAEAKAYNEELNQLLFPFEQYEEIEDKYYKCLDVTGNGIIGYVSIPKIGVELTIYHGTSDEVLNHAAGHLEGSALPVGGDGTHTVISAHRGLPSAKLFTDLDKLEFGDIFKITVLNQVLTYEVDQILIVEPSQLEALNRVQGKEYATLFTCTPYGINSHRLFVRGHRVETEEGSVVVHPDAMKIPVYVVLPAIIIPVLFILLVILLIVYRKPPKKISAQDITAFHVEQLKNERLEELNTKSVKGTDQTDTIDSPELQENHDK